MEKLLDKRAGHRQKVQLQGQKMITRFSVHYSQLLTNNVINMYNK